MREWAFEVSHGGQPASAQLSRRPEKGIQTSACCTPRHGAAPPFRPDAMRHRAYEDIRRRSGQADHFPALRPRPTLERLRFGTDRVLEVGAGSGYQTVLLELAATVLLERVPNLAQERAMR
jgi:protein-L-isoaspartate O-methyltransferase